MTSTTFAATQLLSNQRIDLAIAAMSGTANVSHLACEHQVSRQVRLSTKGQSPEKVRAALRASLVQTHALGQ